MKTFIPILLLAAALLAETGGLMSLPDAGAAVDVTASSTGPWTNPSFENGTGTPTGWTSLPSGFTWVNDPAQCHTGNRCISFSKTSADKIRANLYFPFHHRTMYYKVWAKAAGGDPGAVSLTMSSWDITHSVGAAAISGGPPFSVSLSGLSTTWTEFSGKVSRVGEEHFNDQVMLWINFPALPSGVTVHIDDISLWYEPMPLVLYVTYPNYRGMLWPDQGNTITMKAAVQDPVPRAIGDVSVRVQVVRVSDGTVVDAVNATTLNAVETNTANQWNDFSVTSITYDASGLADGPYYLRGTLRLKSDDSVLYTYPDYKIVKEPITNQRASWKVWVDKYNRVVINGSARFIWGTFWALTYSRNTFVSGSATLSTSPDAYRNIAMGCTSWSTCSTSIAAVTPWNRGYGLNGSSLIKAMADWRFNTLIYYTPFSAANAGINTTTCATYSSGDDHFLGLLPALQDYDIWHLHIVVEYWTGASYKPPFWSACTTGLSEPAAGKAAVQKLVNMNPTNRLGNRNGFLGLYISDEPIDSQTYNGLIPSFNKARSFYDQSLGGLAYYVVGGPGGGGTADGHWGGWNQFMDAAGPDPYPSMGALADDWAFIGTSGSPRYGRSYFWPRRVGRQQFFARPLIPTIQLFYNSGVFPGAAFQKIELVSALAAGSTGILWWQHGSSGGLSTRTESDYLVQGSVNKVIADLMPILEQPISDLSDGPQGLGTLISSVSEAAIKCSSRAKGSRILLACANTTNTEKGVTITMAASIPARVVRAWDNSVITPSGAAFSDTFKGLLDTSAPENSVHLYLIDMQPAAMAMRSVR